MAKRLTPCHEALNTLQSKKITVGFFFLLNPGFICRLAGRRLAARTCHSRAAREELHRSVTIKSGYDRYYGYLANHLYGEMPTGL